MCCKKSGWQLSKGRDQWKVCGFNIEWPSSAIREDLEQFFSIKVPADSMTASQNSVIETQKYWNVHGRYITSDSTNDATDTLPLPGVHGLQ